jgi:hypothetical protein
MPVMKNRAALPLTAVRQGLSPLVKSLHARPGGKVAIAVHGRVQAWLVSREQMESLERRAAPRRKRIDRKALAKLARQAFGDPDTFEERLQRAKDQAMRHVYEDFDEVIKG